MWKRSDNRNIQQNVVLAIMHNFLSSGAEHDFDANALFNFLFLGLFLLHFYFILLFLAFFYILFFFISNSFCKCMLYYIYIFFCSLFIFFYYFFLYLWFFFLFIFVSFFWQSNAEEVPFDLTKDQVTPGTRKNRCQTRYNRFTITLVSLWLCAFPSDFLCFFL